MLIQTWWLLKMFLLLNMKGFQIFWMKYDEMLLSLHKDSCLALPGRNNTARDGL